MYYEIDAPGQSGDAVPVRWLESYDFQQHVPHDVDFRILLTFLELYRTLISFVSYKLYTDENLVYPPPIDRELDEQGETVGALKIVEKKEGDKGVGAASKVSKKEVKKAIKGIRVGNDDVEMDDDEEDVQEGAAEDEEEFVERSSHGVNEDVATAPLTTYSTIVATNQSSSSTESLLFAPYTFYLSRETSSKTWEFVVRAMGGKVISSLTAPSLDSTPLADQITHVIIDRPMTSERMRELQGERKWVWVQPQWVADCVNRGKIIGAGEYAPGQLLPPHLSPWDGEGELQRPWLEENGEATAADGDAVDADVAEAEDDEDDSDEEEEDEDETELPPALLAAASNPSDPTLVHAAELEAERNGTSHAAFTAQLKAATKAQAGAKGANKPAATKETDEDLRKIMMSNKKAKLYKKMVYSNKEQAAEVGSTYKTLDLLLMGRKQSSRRRGRPSRSASERRPRAGRRAVPLPDFGSVRSCVVSIITPSSLYAVCIWLDDNVGLRASDALCRRPNGAVLGDRGFLRALPGERDSASSLRKLDHLMTVSGRLASPDRKAWLPRNTASPRQRSEAGQCVGARTAKGAR